MSFKGFEISNDKYGVRIDLLMPRELKEIFFASIYCKGSLCDGADGEPAVIWRALSEDFDGKELIAPQQVHGKDIIDAAESAALPYRPEADGILLSAGTQRFASLRFADCAPVVLAGIADEPWIMLLHSGFKGTLQNIAAAGVKRTFDKYGAGQSEKIWAWIGPAIGRECYSRMYGDPSTSSALERFSPENYTENADGVNFDIKGEIARQLSDAGVNRDKIYVYGECTCCRNDLFYSYRAGDRDKRMFLLAGAQTPRHPGI